MVRGKEIEELAKDPPAFVLMWQIAYRARRNSDFSVDNLKVGEALIGDYANIGLTRRQYRTRLDRLTNWGFVTIKTTNRGTIATIVDKRVYDINANSNDQQTNHQEAIKRPTDDHQEATNKKVKKEKKEKKTIYSPEFELFWKAYVRGEEKKPAYTEWLKINPDPQLIEHIMTAVAQQKSNGCLKDPKFAPYARRWIKNTRWTDRPIKAVQSDMMSNFDKVANDAIKKAREQQ